MDRQTLRDWVIRFNAEGVEGLRDRPKSGRPPWLDQGQMAAFKALVLRGPDPERDGVSTWRAKDLCRIVEQRFGVVYSENACSGAPRPRPVLAKGAPDPSRGGPQGPGPLQKKFPVLIAEVARDHPEAERLEVWFLDEARVGQTGRVCRRWYQRGLRPRGVRDLRHQAVYLFGAVCPARDAGVALVLPSVSAAAMQAMLDELGQAVSPGAHAVVLMDRAGWHIAKDLTIPANLTPLFLPPYSPELNAIERVWLYLRERFLSHRLWSTYDDILDACCQAWNALLAETGRISSLCALDWSTQVSS
jgi:hypothetical protein